MRNLLFRCSFAGTNYFGFQKQKRFISIEETLEKAFMEQTGEQVTVIGCGRTDARVHAMNFYFNVTTNSGIPEERFPLALNCILPDDIAVKEVREASERFHARYKAVGKLYRYTCYDGPVKPVFQRKYVAVLEKRPDVEKMQQAAAYLEGKHDYKSFCGNPRMKKSTVRVVDKIEITRKGSFIYFDFHGTGFLQNMVRILVGTLLEVGKGKIKPEQIPEILEAKNRQMAGPTAPAQGLCLIKVDY